MKKGLLLVLAVSLFLGTAVVNVSTVSAQEAAAVPEAEEATGEIVSISSERLSMIVKYLVDEELQSYRTATFYFTDTTKILKDDIIVNFTDLKVGDTVTLNYTKEDGWKKMVTSAAVKTAAETTEAETTEVEVETEAETTETMETAE